MDIRNRNKGFSLIELIVTIAIMVLVTGASMSIYSWIRTHRIQEMSENVSDCLSELRTCTMTRSENFYLELEKTSDGDFVGVIYKDSSKYKTISISSSGHIYLRKSSVRYELKNSEKIRITYNKNGALDSIKFIRNDGTEVDTDSTIYLTHSNLAKTVKISKKTGKHYIE